MKQSISAKTWIVIIAAICLFLSLGFFAENDKSFSGYNEKIRSRSININLLNYGNLGRILKRNGNIISLPSPDYQLAPSLRQHKPGSVFNNKRSSSNLFYMANPSGAQSFPSSSAVPEAELQKGWPVVSIVVDPDYLYHQEKGIIANDGEKGNEWERLSYLSYFEKGNLLFSSGVGLRAHGGRSRGLFNDAKSLRVYFRKEYGSEIIPERILFSGKADPLDRIVLRISEYRPGDLFLNAFAFDVARKVGAIVPETSPARLFLNGEDKGIYFLSEHLKKSHWRNHVGHDDFYFYRDRGTNDAASDLAYQKTLAWVKNEKIPMTFREAEKHVDLDNFTNHIISAIFCGTTDWEQGAAVRSFRNSGEKWHWVNWDMDQSFRDFAYESRKENVWEQRALLLVIGDGNINTMRLRPALFTRLFSDSPEYRQFFLKKMKNVINHLLTKEFLDERLNYYNSLLDKLDLRNRSSLRIIKQFLDQRKDFLVAEMEKYFTTGKALQLIVKNHENTTYSVDGYHRDNDFSGSYFNGDVVTLRATDMGNNHFKHWLVNGKKYPEKLVEVTITSDTKVRLVTWK